MEGSRRHKVFKICQIGIHVNVKENYKEQKAKDVEVTEASKGQG